MPHTHPAYTLTPPSTEPLPIVVDSPHSGTAYPADFGACLPAAQLRRGEDTWIDRLYANAPQHGATLLAANFPRVYIDPNRSLEDIDSALFDEPWPGSVQPGRKTELGIGLVWRLMDSQPIYARKLTVAEVQDRIRHCWLPYHQALDNALADADAAAAAQRRQRWHLNVHSMPDDSFRRLGLPDKVLADVVLGNLDGSTCDEATMKVVTQAFEAAGYSVAHNDPFKGVEIIRASGHPETGQHALQIELKRSLYMNADFEPNAGFARLQSAVDGMLAALAAHARASTRD